MAHKLADNAAESTTTTGTGSYGLAGALAGYQRFQDYLSDTDTTYYGVYDGTNWETGVGTYSAGGNTLARTVVLGSSNTGAAVNWGVGTKTIICAPPAAKTWLKPGSSPTPTLLGEAEFDSARSAIIVGTGASQKRFSATDWETIGFTALSGAASWSQTGLSAYRILRISGHLRPTSDAVSLYLRTDSNNGASFDAGGTDYGYSLLWGTPTPTVSAFDDATEAFISLSSSFSIGNSADEGVSFMAEIHSFNQAQYAYVHGIHSTVTSAGVTQFGTIHGRRFSTSARDAVQVLFSAGNMGGHIALEGIRG